MKAHDSAKKANGSTLRLLTHLAIRPWKKQASGHDTHARSRVSIGFTASRLGGGAKKTLRDHRFAPSCVIATGLYISFFFIKCHDKTRIFRAKATLATFEPFFSLILIKKS